MNNLFGIKGTAKGSSKGKEIVADIALENVNLQVFEAFLPPKTIRNITGEAAAFVKIVGDIADPQINGNILFKNLSFNSDNYIFD
jgi:autotransporter translocation and assembly factor TamB